MAIQNVPDVDFSKSTGAFPLAKSPAPVFVDPQIDYSKSTNAYPMFDDRNDPAILVTHYDAPVSASFPTPGPISSGVEDHVLIQRKQLGLSDDASGESDVGYEARPSSVPVPGADGVDRVQVYERGYLVDLADDDDTGPVVDSSEVVDAVVESDKKAVEAADVEAKVVEPEKAKRPQGRVQATTK